MDQGRREFVKLIAYVGAGTALAACGNKDSKGDCSVAGGTASNITNNHGHALDVPTADFMDPIADHLYSIQGSAAHDHTISLTGAQLQQVLAGSSVTVTSTTTDLHMHDVTVACAGGGPGNGGGGY